MNRIFNVILLSMLGIGFSSFVHTNHILQKDIHRQISFSDCSKLEPHIIEQDIFVKAFFNIYQHVPLSSFKKTIKTKHDLKKWIESVYKKEEKKFKNSENIFCIKASLDNKEDIGVIFYELSNPSAHIRQLAILPCFQRKGVASQLLKYIFSVHSNLEYVMIDVRKTNVNASNFYLKNKCQFLQKPNDKTLDQKVYKGMICRYEKLKK